MDEAKWYKHYNNGETAMNWIIDMMEGAGYAVKVEKGTPGSPTSLYYETCSIGWDYGPGQEPDPDLVVSTGMMQPLLVTSWRVASPRSSTAASTSRPRASSWYARITTPAA